MEVLCQTGLMEFMFIAGNLALDLTATLRARRGRCREELEAPGQLDAWYLEAGVADEIQPCQAPDLEQAVSVREAIYDLVTARLHGRAYGDKALALVNRTARIPSPTPRLTQEGRCVEAIPAEALSAVARSAVELLGGPDIRFVKECGNAPCTFLYIDRSRGFRRAWCSMVPCGNNMKAAAYRARKRESTSP
jgi:predicted RNA-binding Zn ribbon-like protein